MTEYTSGVTAVLRPRMTALLAAAFLAVGALGVYRYVDNYWLYRGFAPPHDA